MSVYFGFGIADGMFPETCQIVRRPQDALQVSVLMEDEGGFISICNPSHVATIEALRQREGIVIEIPEKAPVVKLQSGDSLIVFSPRGLPRLEGRHEYTEEEISKATFVFGLWDVL